MQRLPWLHFLFINSLLLMDLYIQRAFDIATGQEKATSLLRLHGDHNETISKAMQTCHGLSLSYKTKQKKRLPMGSAEIPARDHSRELSHRLDPWG